MSVFSPIDFGLDDLRSRNNHFLRVFARLKPGTTIEQAQGDMDAISAQLRSENTGNQGHASLVILMADIGIRLAIGARGADVVRQFVGEGFALTSLGLVIGASSAYVVTRVMAALLFGVTATEPATFAAIALLVGVVALVAVYIPARAAPPASIRCLRSGTTSPAITRFRSSQTPPTRRRMTAASLASAVLYAKESMVFTRALVVLPATALIAGLIAQPLPHAQERVSFAKDIAPILEGSCWGCHSEKVHASKLDLTSRDKAVAGGQRGPAIIPGRADDSRLYRVVAGLEQPNMPFDGSALTNAQIAAIKTWIDEGAHWDLTSASGVERATTTAAAASGPENAPLPPGARDYWAFKLPVKSAVPNASPRYTNPIDQFLEKTRQARGLNAAPRADSFTLVRRAYLDLIGMPPSPAEIDAFMKDTAPDAWERLIDRLLAKPQYGERWGRHWLDAARYADTDGYEDDHDRPNMWRYRDYVIRAFTDDKPYDVFLTEQLAGDEIDNPSVDARIATAFLRLGPRVAVREADNPQYRYDYLDDIIATIGKGTLGLTLQCARCHNHKFDPILQRDYYALQASLFGFVETTYPLTAKETVDAYAAKVAAIDAKQKPLRDEIRKLEAPYRQRLRAEAIERDFPLNIQRAVAKPEKERTDGERLLADQVLKSAIIRIDVDAAMTPDDLARRKTLQEQIEQLDREYPPAPPAADIVTDGDYRFAPGANTSGTLIAAQLAAERRALNGSFLHKGPERYEAPPSYFLIRGDVNAKGALMKPGFVSVATYGTPPTEIPRPDGHTSGRRLALARWLTARDNPLPARVMVNRIWAHHFGRGIVSTLDNFGKMGERPTHPELLDYLAVEFMNRGWSIKQMHRLMMTSEAYRMASRYADAASAKSDPANDYLWRARIQRLDAEAIRDSIMSVAGTIDLTIGGPPVFPHIQDELLKAVSFGGSKGIYRNQPDGPAVWRRSIYTYAKRNLPFPMMQVFDLPDLNVSYGARNVSTVPTQALTLMNNEFVARQASLFADRIRSMAGENVAQQVEIAYRLALTRPATEQELITGRDFIRRQSLVDFANVLVNLNEFLYTE